MLFFGNKRHLVESLGPFSLSAKHQNCRKIKLMEKLFKEILYKPIKM